MLTTHGLSCSLNKWKISLSSMTWECLQKSVSAKKMWWLFFFFFLLILNMGNLKMNDLLFYICHPGHLSLEFKVRCISHWLHQSTFSSKGQPVGFVWTYDCTADGPHLDSHTGWPPAAHSNVGAASMLGWPWCTLKAASLVHCAATSSLQDNWMNNRMMH